MTRITNAGLSRGYVKAGFHSFTAGEKFGADAQPRVENESDVVKNGEPSSSRHKRRATEALDNGMYNNFPLRDGAELYHN